MLKKLEELIIEAVKPYQGLPITLSGGVDSSLLAALIKPKFAISVRLPGGEKYNETRYSKIVAKYLRIPHIVVKLIESNFDEDMKLAVKAIGRPIPHFNIFPLFSMYRALKEFGVKEVVLGDGPDETMCGYARDMIITHLYRIFDFETFKPYKPLIEKILPPLEETLANATGQDPRDIKKVIRGKEVYQAVGAVNIKLMRKDMDDMSNNIAKYFGITNRRPYQDNKELDKFMYGLKENEKIHNIDCGKYLLRQVAEKYLPHSIAWRKFKVGGPVYPVNKKRKWMKKGEWDKEAYLEYQKTLLQ
jgi:asparagine synthetase B (glutamine-hydrolysing)